MEGELEPEEEPEPEEELEPEEEPESEEELEPEEEEPELEEELDPEEEEPEPEEGGVTEAVVMITVLVLSCHSTSASKFSETNRNGTKVRPFTRIGGLGTVIRIPFL